MKIPEGASFEDASCATVGSIALQGIRQCDLRLGENACVMGLGLLGLLAVQMLKASGIRRVAKWLSILVLMMQFLPGLKQPVEPFQKGMGWMRC